MRRWRFLTLALAVLLTAGLGVSAAHVQSTGRNVVYDETILQGEAEAFSGIVRQVAVLPRARINRVTWATISCA